MLKPFRVDLDQGAIAQLGERVLCKLEVVGSIPSGSTIAARMFRFLPGSCQDSRSSSRATMSDAMFEIVKREYIRQPGCLVLRHAQRRPRRPLDRVCSASKTVFWRNPKDWSFCYVVSRALPRRRTSIMRAIKCLKSIRWMPWR